MCVYIYIHIYGGMFFGSRIPFWAVPIVRIIVVGPALGPPSYKHGPTNIFRPLSSAERAMAMAI